MLTARRLWTIGAFIAGFAPAVAHANLVVDGNFDAPPGGGSFTTYSAGSDFGPWHVNSGSVDLIGGYWQSPTGPTGGSVDLDGFFQAGSISQELHVSNAGLYNLTFALAGNPDNGPGDKTVLVTLSTANQTYTFTVTNQNHSDMGYIMESLNGISLDVGAAILTFASKDDATSAYGPVIGDVNVSAVPEPSTWAMMILGFLGLGFLGYRKKTTLRLA